MEGSNSYTRVERMIQVGEIMLSDLERWLVILRRQELITATEHDALLKLAWNMNVNQIRSLFSGKH